MKFNKLGNTNIEVSELGFGTSSIGGMFRASSEKKSIITIHHAMDRGINYFDTSPCYGRNTSLYGPETAEILLGKGLKGIRRSEFFLSTKAGKLTSIPPEFNFRYDAIIKSVEKSLRRLEVDFIDIVNLHDIEYHQGKYIKTALEEGLEALSDLKKQGKIGYFGIACYSMEVLEIISQQCELDTLLVHNHYTLIDDLLLKLLPLVRSKGIGLINASPFASGLLTSKEIPDWHPISKQGQEIIKKAIDFCRLKNVPIEKLAMQYALTTPEIPTTLFSCSSKESIDLNVKWIEEPLKLDLIMELQNILEPIRNTDYNFGNYNHQ
jgi:aryl-alcohol dehydrogenase-like predicted oxidoreductase